MSQPKNSNENGFIRTYNIRLIQYLYKDIYYFILRVN